MTSWEKEQIEFIDRSIEHFRERYEKELHRSYFTKIRALEKEREKLLNESRTEKRTETRISSLAALWRLLTRDKRCRTADQSKVFVVWWDVQRRWREFWRGTWTRK